MSFSSGMIRGTARLQMRLHQAHLERNQLVLRVALKEREAKELGQLDRKYDGARAKALQDEINRRSNEKETIAGQYENVARALKRIEDIKIDTLDLKDAASLGSGSAWNNALDMLRTDAGSYILDNDNLIGNTGQGRWGVHNEVVGGLGLDTTVRTAYLGADYVVELTDGTVLKPDFSGTLTGGGLSLDTGTLTITGRAGANNDIVTFEDAGGTPYTGTIKTPRGYSITLDSGQTLVADSTTERLSGGGIDLDQNAVTLVQRGSYSTDPAGTWDRRKIEFTSGGTTYRGTMDFDGPPMTEAWLYNNFATAADQERGKADADMMMRHIDQVERELQGMLDSLSAAVDKFNGHMSELTDEWDRVSEEEFDEKSAARKAIMARTAIAEQAFALSGTYGANVIEGIFHGESGWERKKSGVFDVINQTPDYS